MDVTHPFCSALRRRLLEADAGRRLRIIPTGTYVRMNGFHFEAAAEVRMLAQARLEDIRSSLLALLIDALRAQALDPCRCQCAVTVIHPPSEEARFGKRAHP